jgi:hypothetical protein
LCAYFGDPLVVLIFVVNHGDKESSSDRVHVSWCADARGDDVADVAVDSVSHGRPISQEPLDSGKLSPVAFGGR